MMKNNNSNNLTLPNIAFSQLQGSGQNALENVYMGMGATNYLMKFSYVPTSPATQFESVWAKQLMKSSSARFSAEGEIDVEVLLHKEGDSFHELVLAY